MNDQKSAGETRGMLLVFASYVIWGLFPLYWRLLDGVASVEIALHRIVWCTVFAGAMMFWRGRWGQVRRILRHKKLAGALALSGSLVAIDWTCYIWGVASRQLVEVSLGLFVTPLFSIFLGVVLLGERISPMRMAALFLGMAALLAQVVAFGHIPWIALGISVCFGLYGYVRKLTPVDPLDGLLIETGLLTPFALVALLVMGALGVGAFRLGAVSTDFFLVFSGVVTAVPLILFVSGARRIRLSSVGFVQYFSPGLTLALAIFGFREKFSVIDAGAFVCLWCALILLALETRLGKVAGGFRKKTV